jgi:DNA-binding transcriptional LysR family regulator
VAGIPFFVRTASGFVPTPEVQALMDDLEGIHDNILNINRRLEAAKAPTEGRLAIGVSPGLGVSLVPRALVAMRREHPGVQVEFDVLHREEFVAQLVLQQVDLALAIFDLEDPRIETTALAEGGLVCLLPDTHRLARRRTVSIGDLAGEPFIGFNEHQFQQTMIDGLLARSGVTLKPAMRVRLTVSAYFMVQSGLGIALLDNFTVAGPLPPGLRAVPLDEHVPFTLRLFHNPTAPLSQVAQGFVAALRATLP